MQVHRHLSYGAVIYVDGVHVVGAVEGVRGEEQNGRLKAHRCKANDIYQVFLEFRAIDVEKGVIDPEMQHQNLRAVGVNFFVKCPDSFEGRFLRV